MGEKRVRVYSSELYISQTLIYITQFLLVRKIIDYWLSSEAKPPMGI